MQNAALVSLCLYIYTYISTVYYTMFLSFYKNVQLWQSEEKKKKEPFPFQPFSP